jgi:hypothetical protein
MGEDVFMGSDEAQYSEEEQRLIDEIEEYNRERNRIKMIVGKLGGKQYSKREMIINIVLFAVIIILFVLEITVHIIPAFLSLELGIFLVSIKIIMMIHSQQKSNHFQFWVLKAIEFRMNEMHKKMREMEKYIYEQKDEE